MQKDSKNAWTKRERKIQEERIRQDKKHQREAQKQLNRVEIVARKLRRESEKVTPSPRKIRKDEYKSLSVAAAGLVTLAVNFDVAK